MSESHSVMSDFSDPMDYSLPGSSVHGILQARILEWVAIPFSRGSSQPRDRAQVSCIAGDSLLSEPPGKPKNTGMVSLSLLQGIQQPKKRLFKKNGWISEQQILWHFSFPHLNLSFSAVLQTNSFATKVAVKASSLTLEGAQSIWNSTKASPSENCLCKLLISGFVLFDLNQRLLCVNSPISKALVKN